MALSYSSGFSKSFDLVKHTILLRNLKLFGTRGIAHFYILPYLQHEVQVIRIAGE